MINVSASLSLCVYMCVQIHALPSPAAGMGHAVKAVASVMGAGLEQTARLLPQQIPVKARHAVDMVHAAKEHASVTAAGRGRIVSSRPLQQNALQVRRERAYRLHCSVLCACHKRTA